MDMNEKLLLLNEIEKQYPVEQWVVGDLHVWPIVRNDIAFKILGSTTKTKSHNSNNATRLKFDENEKHHYVNLKEEQDFLLISNFDHRINIDRKYFNRFTDSVKYYLNKKGYKSVTLEHNIRNNKDMFFEDWYTIDELLYSDTPIILANMELPEFEKVEKAINGVIFNTVAKDKMLKKTKIYEISIDIIRKAKRITKILEITKPKGIFLVNFTAHYNIAWSYAAFKYGIPSIDIQHGNHYPLIYHNWYKNPEGGYNSLPKIFTCWTKEDHQKLKNWLDISKSHRSVNIGNVWSEFWRANKFQLISKDDQSSLSLSDNKIFILITLQPMIYLEGWQQNIPDFILKFIENTPDNYKFLIRYHPAMNNIFIEEKNSCEQILKKYIEKGKVETKLSSNLPLFLLLENTKLHITAHSTCVREALEFGVGSIVIHKYANTIFDNEIKQRNQVLYCDNYEDIVEKSRFFIYEEKKQMKLCNNTKKIYDFFKTLYDTQIIDNKPIEMNNIIPIENINQLNYLLIKEKCELLGIETDLLINAIVRDLLNKRKLNILDKLIKDLINIPSDYYFMNGKLLYIEENYEKAIVNFQNYFINIINKTEHNIFIGEKHLLSAYFYTAQSYFALKEFDQSEIYFKKCIELTKNNHEKAKEMISRIREIRTDK